MTTSKTEDGPAFNLTEDDLETIEQIARNKQTGRIYPSEIHELVAVYRAALSARSTGGQS